METWSERSTKYSVSNSDLTVTKITTTGWHHVRSSARSSGKFYFEVRLDSVTGANNIIGIADAALALETQYPGVTGTTCGYFGVNGTKIRNAGQDTYGSAFTEGDVVGVAVDLDAGKIWFSKNNTWQASGDPAAGTNPAYTGITGSYMPAVALYAVGTVATGRFLAADFSYSPPSGFSPFEDVPVPITGDIAATIPLSVCEIVGTVPVVGSLSAIMPPSSMEITGTVPANGDITATLPFSVCEMTGTSLTPVMGSLEVTLPVAGMDMAGTVPAPPIHGTFTITMAPYDGVTPGRSILLPGTENDFVMTGAQELVSILEATLPMSTMEMAGPMNKIVAGIPMSTMTVAGMVFKYQVNPFLPEHQLPMSGMWIDGSVLPIAMEATLPVPTCRIDCGGALGGDLPMSTCEMAGENPVVGNVRASLPMSTAKIRCGGTVNSDLPMSTCEMAAAVVIHGRLQSAMPLATMVASGRAPMSGPMMATLPMTKVVAGGHQDTVARLAAMAPAATMRMSGAARQGVLLGDGPMSSCLAAGTVPIHGNVAGILPVTIISLQGLAKGAADELRHVRYR